MAYKTLDEAFKDTFTPAPARTVSMEDAFKATFGDAPSKPVSLDEAFANTFGAEPTAPVEKPKMKTLRHRGKEYTVSVPTTRADRQSLSKAAPPRPLAVIDDSSLALSAQKALNERLGKAAETLDAIKKSGNRNVRIRDEGDLSGLGGRTGPRLETPEMAYERYLRELESITREYENYRRSGQEYDAGAAAIGGHQTYNPAPQETAGMHDPVNTLANILAFGGAGAAKAVQAGAGNLSNMIRMAGAEGLNAAPVDIAKALLSPAPRAFARSAAQVLASEAGSELTSRGAGGLMDYAGVEDPAVRAILQSVAGQAGGLFGSMAASKAIAPPNVKPALRVHGTRAADDLERMALNTGGTSPTAKGVASVMDDLRGVGLPPALGQGVIPPAIGPGDPNALALSLLRERGNTELGHAARMMAGLMNGGRRNSIDDIVSALRKNPSRRIDPGSVIDRYGESALDSLPLGTDSAEGRTSIDEMAARLGYENGDRLIAELSAYREREAQRASQAIQNELGMSPEEVARYTSSTVQDAEWPYSDPSLQVTPEQRRAMEFDAIRRDAAVSASSTPGTRENALAWIRKNGGLDYRAIRDSYGREEALQLRKRLGPGVFKTDGVHLDKAAQGLALEGAAGLDSDTALFQTLMGEGVGVRSTAREARKEPGKKRQPVAAIRDRAEKSGALTYEAYGKTYHRLKEPRYPDPDNKTISQNWVRDDLMNPTDELADESVYRNKWGRSHAEWVKEREGTQVQALPDGNASSHAMDKDVDLGRRVQVKILPTADRKTLSVEDGSAIIRAFGKDGIENSDTGARITLARRGADHIRHTANNSRGEEKMALISAFEHLPEIAKGAVRVKTTGDRKPKGRQTAETSSVRSVRRFLAPVRYGESVYVLKLTAKEIGDGRYEIDVDPSDPRVIKLHDQSIAKKISGNTSNGGSETGASSTPVFPDSEFSIGEMAVDVKDTLDERPYLTKEEYEKQTGNKYPYGQDVQRLAVPTGERRFFEPEKPVREPGETAPEEPVTIAEIRQAVDRLVPWRHGKTARGTLGNFKVEPEVVRSKNRNDVPVIMHELGHFLDKKLGLRNIDAPGAEQELASNGAVASTGQYTPEQIRGEGVAQFFLHYAVDERQAREKFPEYYQAFEEALATHPELRGDVAEIKRLVSSYSRQTAGERLQANIVRGADRIPAPVKERAGKAYGEWIDALAPLQRVVEDVRRKLGVEHLPDNLNLYAKARTAPGFKGRAGQDTTAFLDVVRELNPEDHAELSNYLAASRALNYRAKGMEPGLGTSPQEDRHVFSSAPDHIKNAAMKLHDVYNDMVQKTLVKTGIMSQEQFDYLQMEWPDYVPFIRADTTAMIEHDLAAFMRGSKKSLANLGNPIKKATGVGDAASVYPIRDPLEAMLRNMQVFHSLAARNEVGKTMINIAGIEGMGRFAERVNGPGEKGDKVFYVWNDGKKEYYATDPGVYDALMAVNEGSPDSMGFLSKTLIKVADWFKMGTTRYNPAFALFRNLPRDSWEAAVNSESWAPPMVNSVKGLIIQYSGDPRMKAILDEAIQEGVLYSGITEIRGNSPETLAKELKKAFREGGMTGAVKRKFVNLWEWVGSKNEAIEVAPKLQEYLYLRSKGVPKQEAAMRAREVNIDFARAGTKGRVVNRYTAFFNAQVQGLDKAARTFKARPKETALKMALFAGVPSLVAWALGNFDDDETKKQYNDIPKGLKDLYWHYKVGGEWLRLPKPNAYGIFGSLVERALDSAYAKDPAAFRGFMDTLWDEAVPPVVPSALMPAIEVWANKNSFTGRAVVPRKYENLPPEMQYGPQTSWVAKQMGELLGVSPMAIDHMIRGVTGTVGGEIAKLPDRVVGDRNREAEKLTELPLIRTSFSQPYRNSESIDRFYEVAEQTNRAKIRYETKRKAGEKAEAGKDLRFAQQFARASKSLSDLRKQRAAIQQHPSLSPASKRKYLDKMDEQMADLAREVLERYDKYGN